MELRQLARDLQVSRIDLGCNNFGTRLDPEGSTEVVRTALDEGVTHFDTATMYGNGRSEEILGKALAGQRDQVVIATKAIPRPREVDYKPGVLARSIEDSCEASLRRLSTDRIDLYYQHVPDPDAPLEEALEALNGLVAKGKARHVACSNYSADQMRQAEGIATGTGASHLLANQVEWNLLNRAIEADIVPAAHEVGMSIIPFFPLASGMLTGKYTMRRPFPTGSRLASAPYFATLATEENFEYVEKLSAFAQAHGHSILELAIAWLCAQESVPSVIIGAMNPEQVRSNVAAAEWKLDDDVLAALPSRP
jgi:aryl-alcohol dehydrogenase-like predicted oxidoreductase